MLGDPIWEILEEVFDEDILPKRTLESLRPTNMKPALHKYANLEEVTYTSPYKRQVAEPLEESSQVSSTIIN